MECRIQNNYLNKQGNTVIIEALGVSTLLKKKKKSTTGALMVSKKCMECVHDYRDE